MGLSWSPQLVVVHLANPLALDPSVLGQTVAFLLVATSGLSRARHSGSTNKLLGVGPLEPVERRHSDVGVAVLDERTHVTEQEVSRRVAMCWPSASASAMIRSAALVMSVSPMPVPKAVMRERMVSRTGSVGAPFDVEGPPRLAGGLALVAAADLWSVLRVVLDDEDFKEDLAGGK